MRKTIAFSLKLKNGGFIAITSEGPESRILDESMEIAQELAKHFPVSRSSLSETLRSLESLKTNPKLP